MYYRNKNLKPRDVQSAFQNIAKQDNKFIDSFWVDLTKQLTQQQNDLNLKTINQCSVRTEVITKDLNERLKKMQIKKRLNQLLVDQRLIEQEDEQFMKQQCLTPTITSGNQNNISASLAFGSMNQKSFSQLAANQILQEQNTLPETPCSMSQGPSEITKRQLKQVIQKKFKKIADKIIIDRAPTQQRKVQKKTSFNMNNMSPLSHLKDGFRAKSSSSKSVRPSPLVNMESIKCQLFQQRRLSIISQDTEQSTQSVGQNILLRKAITYKDDSPLIQNPLIKSQSSNNDNHKDQDELITQASNQNSQINQQYTNNQTARNDDAHQSQQFQLKLQLTKNNKKFTPKRLETIVEPSMEFKEDISETISEEESSIFQFMSSDSEIKGEQIKTEQLNSRMMVDESVFRDITFYHRQETRETHELFTTQLVISNEEAYHHETYKDQNSKINYQSYNKAKQQQQCKPKDCQISFGLAINYKINNKMQ
ncbi:UNKNOWN [Stylonychia lemnae]|uniref:Uncharacterized protein n=1 Tax=Stylonychia lemnae TaxID=5949 RepID=A0A078AXR2_STYLE|nr:UNKNOWN [Stylonychia lemnae]|eukprot:CDW86027.1 UNKNOWN [Stylonychia lemnae]